jgi:hypothetical protein
MKQLVLDDLSIGQAVTILHGPYENVIMPPVMLEGADPPSIDTAIPGRVFMIEAIDMNMGMIMLKALDGGGPSEQKLTQMGSLMALMGPPSKPDTFMFELSKIVLAAVSPDWLTAYVRNFCSHKGGIGELARNKLREKRTALEGQMASKEGPGSSSNATV